MAKNGKPDYASELTAYIKVHEAFDKLKVEEKEIIARINKDHIKEVDFNKKENSVIEVEGKSYALSVVQDRNSKKAGSEKVFKYTIHAANIIENKKEEKTESTVAEPTAKQIKEAEKAKKEQEKKDKKDKK